MVCNEHQRIERGMVKGRHRVVGSCDEKKPALSLFFS
jgi:hypothetical protein